MELTLELRGFEELREKLGRAAPAFEAEVFQALRLTALEAGREARRTAPRFTGTLRRGIRVRADRKTLMASVRATAPHSWLVEHGRTPGKMPSVDPARSKSAARLVEWAKARGISPFVLARAIGQKGTRPRPFIAPLAETVQGRFEQRVQAAAERVIAGVK